MPRLPNELILQIIECLVPPITPVALPPSHPVTSTLLSLTLVSRVTYRAARQLLVKYCLYIDSNRRLDGIINCEIPPPSPDAVNREIRTIQGVSATGLFLSPFPDNSLEEPRIVRQVDQLLSSICGNLRRLVIDMPLRYLFPEDDHQGIRVMLHAAFNRLTMLEEFCSVQDELYCDTIEGASESAVWSTWPRLRCLALYNADLSSSEFVESVRRCSNLTHLVLTRADGLTDPVSQTLSDGHELPLLKRVIIVNTESGHQSNMAVRLPGWQMSLLGQIWLARHVNSAKPPNVDLEIDQFLVHVSVPVPPERTDDDIKLCQEWVSSHATEGTLWDVPGCPFYVDDQG